MSGTFWLQTLYKLGSKGVTERSVEFLRLTAGKCKRGEIFAPKISLLQHAFCVLGLVADGR